MSESRALTLPVIITDRVVNGSRLKNVAVVVGASLVLAVSAQVAVPLPFSPVPMTLQPLALLLIGGTLGARRGFAAALLYLFEGLCGAPVFSMGRSGIGMLLGPTAGYLYAFPFCAMIAGYAADRGWTKNVLTTALSMAAALSVNHLFGWAWLSTVMNFGAENAFITGVVPFLPGDLIKIAIAAALLPSVQRMVGSRKTQ